MTGAYTSLLALAALLNAAGGGFVYAQSPERKATRAAALLLFAAAWWALCELFVALADDAPTARSWLCASTFGWIFIAGLTTDIVTGYIEEQPHPSLEHWRRLARWARTGTYGVAFLCLPLAFAEGWMYGPLERTAWGWTYEPGTILRASYVIVVPAVLTALGAIPVFFRLQVSESERRQRRWIWMGVASPLLGVAGSEVLMPLMHVSFPRVGGASYAVLALAAVATSSRYGVSFFSPTFFSNEMLDALRDGVAMLNANNCIRSANRGLAELSGYSGDALQGMPLEKLLGSTSEWPKVDARDVRGQLASASGAGIPVSISAASSHDRLGNNLGRVVVIRDLREIEDLRRRVTTQSRLAAVGELAAGIAHEINNPLAFVRANLSLLGEHWRALREGVLEDRDDELREIAREGEELIEESLEGVARAGRIVQEVKSFTHAGGGNRERCELNDLVERALAMLQPQLERPALRVELDLGTLPSVICATQGVEQVLMNLIVNAAQAVGERRNGRIRIRTRADGELVTVSVEDNGPGIDPQVIDRIFDPFFTTKKPGEGTGLGLGIAYQVVRAHDGVITVDSQPGEGARFRVHLPIGEL